MSAVFSSAFAADLPGRISAPPVAPLPAFTWTGFYVGAHAGYGSGETKSGESWDVDGALGGLQAGFNYQLGAFVLGLEADISLTDLKGDASYAESATFGTIRSDTRLTVSSQLDWLGTVRPRIGYAIDHTLLYATGGFAFADFQAEARASLTTTFLSSGTSFTSSSSARDSQTVYGWTVGGGVEHAFTPNLSAKLEYSYVKLDRDEDFDRVSGGDAYFKGHLGRVGVNYRF